MANLLSIGISAPVTFALSSNILQSGGRGSSQPLPSNISVKAQFSSGVGSGTGVTLWLQTSLDAMSTWSDVCVFAFTTTSTSQGVNLTASTFLNTTTLTDGTLAVGVSNNGLFGNFWRAKYSSSGNLSTTPGLLRLDLIGTGLTSFTSGD
jgi:hypothetical protein